MVKWYWCSRLISSAALLMCLVSGYVLLSKFLRYQDRKPRGLIGRLLFERHLDGRTSIVIKWLPEGTENTLFETNHAVRYQVSPTEKLLLVEEYLGFENSKEKTLFYLIDLNNYQRKLLNIPPESRYALWVNENTISILQIGIGEVHYNLQSNRLIIMHKFSAISKDISEKDYLEYLLRRFAPKIHLFNIAIQGTKLQKTFQFHWLSEQRRENPILCFLRTLGVWLHPPLGEVAIDVFIAGREACISRDGLYVAFNAITQKGRLCEVRVVNLKTNRLKACITKAGWLHDLRWLPDNQHILLTWSQVSYVTRYRKEGSFKMPIKSDFVCILDVQKNFLKIITTGSNGFWLSSVSK